MAGTMSQADLVADLKASLHDAASVFTAANDADFVRHLAIAALDFGRVLPLVKTGTLTLVADTASYAAPADLLRIDGEMWSSRGTLPQPWEASYPGQLPRPRVVGASGGKLIVFTPPPSAAHILALGSAFSYLYSAAHAIGAAATDTTIAAGDRGLLLLRAQAEALREMAIRNVGKPVQLRDGLSGTPRNGTPAALYQALLDEFNLAAA